MNKRLNVPLLLGLVVGTTIFAASVFLLHRYQVRRNAAGLLDRADAYRKQGDLDQSIRLVDRYLRYRPEDVEQLKYLAIDAKKRFLEKAEFQNRRDLQKALGSMERALREPENSRDIELRREAADFWMKLGPAGYKDALAHLELIIDSSDATYEDAMNLARCRAFMGGAKETEAVELLNKIISEHPEGIEAYTLLAAIYRDKRGDNAAALDVMKKLVEANSNSHKAFLEIARHVSRVEPGKKGLEQARPYIEKAMELEPNDEEAILAYQDLLKSAENYDEAQKLLEEGLKKLPKSAAFYLGLFNLAIREIDAKRAMYYVEEGLKAIPDDTELMWTKAQLQIDERDTEGLARSIERLEAVNAPRTLVEYLKARELVSNGEWHEGNKRLSKLRPLVADQIRFQIDLLLARCHQMLGQTDARLNDLERIVEDNPNMLSVHIDIGECLSRLGRLDEALAKFERVKATLEGDGKDVPAVVSTSILDLKVRKQEMLPESERSWREVEQIVRDMSADGQLEDANKFVLGVQLLNKKGKVNEAIAYADNGLKEHPDLFKLWALRLGLATDKQDGEEVLARMQDALREQEPLRVLLRLARADWAVKFAGDQAHEILVQLEGDVAEFSATQKAQLFEGLSRSHLQLRDNSEAIRLLEASHAENPSVRTLTSIFELVSRGDDPEAVNQVAERIGELAGTNDDMWKMVEASRIVWMIRRGLLEPTNASRARDYMEQVRRNRPDWIPVLMLEAEIHQMSGDQDSAIKALERALEVEPGNAVVIRQLAEWYGKNGRYSEASALMNQLSFRNRSETDKRRQLLMLERQGNIAAGLKLVDEVLPPDSTDMRDHLWRSRIFAKGGMPDEAEAAARKAKDLEPGVPEVWTNLVSLLAQNGKKEEAEAVIQKADLKLPEQQKPLVLGQCYALIGNLQAAHGSFMTVLRSDPDNPTVKELLANLHLQANQPLEAKRYLDEILEGAQPNAKEIPDEVARARRTLARVYAMSGSYAGFEKALDTIQANVPEGGEMTPEDLSLWVGLAALRPEASSHKRAIALLQETQEQRRKAGGSLTDSERFALAQLYEKEDGRWQDVKSITVDILTRGASNPQIVEKWVGWLLKRGELREAEIWKRNLPPTSVTRIRVEAHSLAKQGDHRQAAKKLLELIPQALQRENYPTLFAVAAMLEELGQYDERYYQLAESQLRRLAKQEPRESLRLAAFLGRHSDVKKLDEAISLCQSVASKGEFSPADVAAVALAVVRSHIDELDQLTAETRRVEDWMETLSRERPDDFALMTRLAEFHDMLGHGERVVVLYREILNKAKLVPQERGLILNNLAYALALDGEGEEALTLVAEGIQQYGPTADLLDTRGYAHYVKGDFGKATADFNSAIESGGKTPHKLMHLALAKHALRDREGAADAWHEALSLGLRDTQLPRKLRDSYRTLMDKYGSAARNEAA